MTRGNSLRVLCHTLQIKISKSDEIVNIFFASRLLFFYSQPERASHRMYLVWPTLDFSLLPQFHPTSVHCWLHQEFFALLLHSIREFYVSILWHNAMKSCWNAVILNSIKFEVIYYSKIWFDFHAGKFHSIEDLSSWTVICWLTTKIHKVLKIWKIKCYYRWIRIYWNGAFVYMQWTIEIVAKFVPNEE